MREIGFTTLGCLKLFQSKRQQVARISFLRRLSTLFAVESTIRHGISSTNKYDYSNDRPSEEKRNNSLLIIAHHFWGIARICNYFVEVLEINIVSPDSLL